AAEKLCLSVPEPADVPRRADGDRAEALRDVPRAPHAHVPGHVPRQPGLRALVRMERDAARPDGDPGTGGADAAGEEDRANSETSGAEIADSHATVIPTIYYGLALCTPRTSFLSAEGLSAPASPTTLLPPAVRAFSYLNARPRRARDQRARAWAACGPSSRHPSTSRCRFTRSRFMRASRSVLAIHATTVRRDTFFARLAKSIWPTCAPTTKSRS